jgi:hypothetical protein
MTTGRMIHDWEILVLILLCNNGRTRGSSALRVEHVPVARLVHQLDAIVYNLHI